VSHALVVDDDPLNRMVVQSLLAKNGFRVSEAADGLEALERLRERPECALIVLDLEMPRMGGIELLSRLKASVATAGIPVVVLTGSEDAEAEARLIDLGADDYIEKPVNQARFLARVRAMLRRTAA
jgi:CheY-like chemotaxis protein